MTTNVISEDVQPQQVFDLPTEVVDKMQEIAAKRGRPRVTPVMEYQQIPVEFDSTPISMAADPEIVQTQSGPMIVRRRTTTKILYRRDGRVANIPMKAEARYLNKRDAAGHPIFFRTPPPGTLDKLKASLVCPYCFKKLRASTSLEKAQNATTTHQDDPEVQELLTKMKESGLVVDVTKYDDVEFKLAEHIRVRHGKQAAFRRDPIFERLKEAREANSR